MAESGWEEMVGPNHTKRRGFSINVKEEHILRIHKSLASMIRDIQNDLASQGFGCTTPAASKILARKITQNNVGVKTRVRKGRTSRKPLIL